MLSLSSRTWFALGAVFCAVALFTSISFAQAQEVPAEPTETPIEEQTPAEPVVEESPAEAPIVEETPADPSLDEAGTPTETGEETVSDTAPTPTETPDAETPPAEETTVSEEPAAPAQAPELSTNEPDYAPGSTATIWGKFFQAFQNVILTIVGVNEDGSEATTHTWDVSADDQGSFETYYELINSYVPLYLLAANSTTGEVLAETTFTDANLSVTVNGAGAGNGSVSAPGSGSTGISCTITAGATSGDCAGTEGGSTATKVLTATAALGSTFTGWTNCPSVAANVCTVSTSATLNVTVTANFSLNVVKTNPTLSVTNSPQIYTGSPIAAVISPSTPGTLSDVKYGGSSVVPTNAGTYAVTADFVPTDTTNYNNLNDASAGTFTISPAASVTDVTCSSPHSYTGSPITPCSVTVTSVGVNLTPAPVYSNNTNVGTASASYTYAGDANHAGSSDSANFTIEKANTTTVVTCPVSVVYNTLAQTPCSVLVTGGGLNLTPTPNYSNNTNAGTASASYTYAGDSNHNGSSDSENFDITKADANCTINGYSGQYDGNAHGATGSCTGIGGGALTGLSLGASFTNVPGGTANWSFTNANYADESGNASIVITQAPSVTDVTCPVGPYVYTGLAQTPCSATVTGINLNLTPTPDYSNNTNAGLATASYTFLGDTNHSGSNDSANFTIGKADADCSVTGYDVVYDGAEHVADGSCTGVLDEDLSPGLDLSATAHTNAGTYNDDPWSFEGGTNYNDQNSVVDNQIDQATSETVITCPISVVYTGAAQEPCTATATGAGSLNESVAVTYGNNLNAGTATADATYGGDINHTGSSDSTTFEIEKAPSTVTVDCGVGPYVYTGLAQTPCTATASGVGMTDVNVTASIVYGNNTNAGSATADASWGGDANHEGDTGASGFTIDKAILTVTASSANVLQGASLPTITPSYSGFVNGEVAGVLDTPPTCSNTAANTVTAGNFPTTCSGGIDDNYDFDYVAGTLHVFSLNSVFKGLFNPLKVTTKDFQKNSTIPVKFALNGGTGNFFGGEATLQICDETTGGTCFNAASSGGANTLNIFRYDPVAGQYIFNLSTKMSQFIKGHTYGFKITINEIEKQAIQKAQIKL